MRALRTRKEIAYAIEAMQIQLRRGPHCNYPPLQEQRRLEDEKYHMAIDALNWVIGTPGQQTEVFGELLDTSHALDPIYLDR